MGAGGWPEDESVLEGARSLVFYLDGGVNHPMIQANRLETIGKLMSKGVSLVCLHYAVEVPKERAASRSWIGSAVITSGRTRRTRLTRWR